MRYVLLVLLFCASAQAYGPRTLSGLTQRAALASRLHRVLSERFGCSLGLFEPLRLHLSLLPGEQARDLRTRFLALDLAEGVAPEDSGERPAERRRQPALSWLAAGSVLETVPAWRVRHHYLDPRTGAGLTPRGGTARTALAGVAHGLSGVRDLLTGTAFDGTGLPSTAWIAAAENELSLPALHRALSQAVLAERPEARETALAQALLAAGALLAVLEQAGDPAFVHNDLSPIFSPDTTYARHVDLRYGRAGVPDPGPGAAPPPARLAELFRDGQGQGLAEQTRRLGRRPPPAVLLPLTGRYAARALDFLFRGDLRLAWEDGRLRIGPADVALRGGGLVLLGEEADGRRRVLSRTAVTALYPGAEVALQVPGAFRRLAVLYQGADAQGEPLLLSAQVRGPDEAAPAPR